MSRKVLEIFEWYKQFNKKDIKICSKTKEFDIEITNVALPHLLGLHYINDGSTRLKGRALYNYIKNNNIEDEQILENVTNNNRNRLADVKNRIETFENFMKNLEKGYLFEQTNPNTQIKSNYLVVQTKDNFFLHLGIKQEEISDYITDFSTEIDKNTKDILETYFARNDMDYFDKSIIFEEITDLKVYDEETMNYIPFSFDEEKNTELMKIYNDRNQDFDYQETIRNYIDKTQEKENQKNNKIDFRSKETEQEIEK